MKDPIKIKIAKGLLIFKIGLIAVLSIVASILFFTREPQGLWVAVKQALLDRLGYTIYDDPSIVLAGFSVPIFISFIIAIGGLYCLIKKKQAGFYIFIGLECVYGLNNGEISYFSFIILLLVFSQKNYFPIKKKSKKDTIPEVNK